MSRLSIILDSILVDCPYSLVTAVEGDDDESNVPGTGTYGVRHNTIILLWSGGARECVRLLFFVDRLFR